jgi:dehydrogenase/reductase SDR family member 12
MSFGQFAATSQFYLYGKKHCTKLGWEAASQKYLSPKMLDEISLSGKVFMVTGANGGIGYEISSYLAKKQATVYLICRSLERGEKAREKIIEESNNPNIFNLLCDCSLQRDVRRAWNEFEQHQCVTLGNPKSQLHGLVCNAGALLSERTLTDEGVETTFAAHLLFGTYLLTNLALPTLTATPDSRVVVVSSGGMYNTKFPQWGLATSERGQYDGQFAYAYAKRGQVLLCEEWTKLFPQVKFVSCHPGWVDTDGVTAAYGETKKYLEPLRNLWEGTEGICWLLVAPREELEGGGFYLDRSPQVKHMAGPFFTEGSFTKNTPEEVEVMMKNLQRWSELTGPPPVDWSVIAQEPLVAMKKPIQIEQFMGQWCVQGHIPTFFDQGTVNNIETYAWDEEKQIIRISFAYSNPIVSHGATLAGPSKVVEQKGTIVNSEKTEWSLAVKFVLYWSVSARYLIIGLNEEDPENIHVGDYQSCLVGLPDRSGLWFMTRTTTSASEELYSLYRDKAESLGYDVSKMVRVPYLDYASSGK